MNSNEKNLNPGRLHADPAGAENLPGRGNRLRMVRQFRGWRMCLAAAVVLSLSVSILPKGTAAESDDVEVALSLANFLRSARTVISLNQDLINNPDIADKELTGAAVLAEAKRRYQDSTGTDADSIDPGSRQGRLLNAQMDSIVEVMDEHQVAINKEGLGFKGFVPAVFARLVNEKFRMKVGQEADVKVTAPRELIRNRKALPDEWEQEVIQSKFLLPDWEKDQIFTASTESDGRPAFRTLIPEYYGEGCLQCHGEPKGEIDVTGYPKEGGNEGDLGGVISISLFR